MDHIPVHILQERTKDGFMIRHMKKDELKEDLSHLGVHRDDHYIFFVLEEGMGKLMIDFREVRMMGHTLYYILPGQVHYSIQQETAVGWFIAVETSLVPQECRNVFESQFILQQPYPLNPSEYSQCLALLTLLLEKHREEAGSPFYITVVHSLLQSFIGSAAGYYNPSTGLNNNVSRPAQITSQFKKQLTNFVRSNKSPAYFAAMLNISEAYLSEVLKKQTGFPASYWIQQEVVMEAKRLLYYTELSAKEIAHHLGYSDHSYFSRLFRKVTGGSAIAFRNKYRE